MDLKEYLEKTELREIYFQNKFSPYAEGSCLLNLEILMLFVQLLLRREFQYGLEENKKDGSQQNME